MKVGKETPAGDPGIILADADTRSCKPSNLHIGNEWEFNVLAVNSTTGEVVKLRLTDIMDLTIDRVPNPALIRQDLDDLKDRVSALEGRNE